MKKIITIILVTTIAFTTSSAFAMSNNFVSFHTIQQTQTSALY